MNMTAVSNKCPYSYQTLCVHGNCELSSAMQQNIRLVAFPKPCAIFLQSVAEDQKTFIHDVQMCIQCSVCIRWIDLCNNYSRINSLTDITHETYVCSTHFVNGEGPTETHPDPLSAGMVAQDEEVDPLMIVKEESNDFCKEEPPDEKFHEAIEAEHFVFDHEYSCQTSSDRHIARSCLILKELGLKLLDQKRSIKYDGESLTVYLFNENLAEKQCVLDREFKIQIFLVGHKIDTRNFFWTKYPNVWNEFMDFGRFIKEFFEDWQFCKPFYNNKKLLEATIIGLNADNQEHRYRFDVVSNCARSPNCTYLSLKRVCYFCRKLETYLETGRTQPTCNYQLQAILNSVKKQFSSYQQERLYNLKNKSDQVCQNLLDKIFVQNCTDPITDIMMIFYDEVESSLIDCDTQEWHPLMIEWCTRLFQQSEYTYDELGKIFNIPSMKSLIEAKKPPSLVRNEVNSTGTRSLLIRKDIFLNDAMLQPSQSSEAGGRSLESEEWDYYHRIEMAQQRLEATQELM